MCSAFLCGFSGKTDLDQYALSEEPFLILRNVQDETIHFYLTLQMDLRQGEFSFFGKFNKIFENFRKVLFIFLFRAIIESEI